MWQWSRRAGSSSPGAWRGATTSRRAARRWSSRSWPRARAPGSTWCTATSPSRRRRSTPRGGATLSAVWPRWPPGTILVRILGRHSERGLTMEYTRLNQSDEYRRRREELRTAEVDLMRQQERVAELRRGLPLETVVQDYEFVEAGSDDRVRLSELFTRPSRTLIVYHYMF